MILVIAEKPSVAQTIAAVLGAKEKKDGFLTGSGYLVSWCVGHLVGLSEAAAYGEQYKKWSYDSLPILPQEWKYTVASDKEKQFKTLKELMHRADVSEVVNACDAGREGELIFRFVYEMAGCKKPMRRLWISSMEDSAIKEGFSRLKNGEEYDALETRNQYLNDQRNDVVKSRDDLMKLIRDLDSTMVSVFKSAFDDTAEAFEQMFATLFPGGTGRLRLENPEDMLTTGVLVEASPAGKRVKQLSLLSGGERSLTALALLFAIFTARPSPFYVMDEVEAALDDVNLTRLINAFNELRAHAQLIIITHQQRTMSIADALYGVTMRADGVTAVVSQKLER